jgi:hypothetical protein
MKEIKRAGNMPKSLGYLLKDGDKLIEAMNKMSGEDVPKKPPIIYECSSKEEVMEQTKKESGQPQVVFDRDHQRVFIVGMAFGRRQTAETILDPTGSVPEEWRSLIFYCEITETEWVEWRENWSKERDKYRKETEIKDMILNRKRKDQRDKRLRFRRKYGSD